jgi:putative flippase GtrA
MRLIPNWLAVLRYGWSVRLIVLAGILTGLEAILPLVPELLPAWFPIEWMVAAQFLIVMGALVSRFIAQSKVTDP